MDISSLLSSLSADDIEKLKSTAQQFFGAGEGAFHQEEKRPESAPVPEMSFDPSLITGVARVSQLMNENDEKSAFITALKPLLSDARKKKADDAVMMLKFFKILSLLQESGR